MMLHSCVDFTFEPSGKLMVSGLLPTCLLITGVPSITNKAVAPVLAMAWEVLMVIALRYCCKGVPKMLVAVATIDICFCAKLGYLYQFFVFNITTVLSSTSSFVSNIVKKLYRAQRVVCR